MSAPPQLAQAGPRQPRRHRSAAWGLWLGLGLGLTVTAGAAWWWSSGRLAAEGAALFEGRRPLDARIQGHDDRLPPAAARCSNCHAPAALRQAAVGTGVATSSFGPVLDGHTLNRPQARRGGPASRYDAGSLCRALRDGIDPAWITLPRSMPRYRLTDAECAALWAHLSRSPAHAAPPAAAPLPTASARLAATGPGGRS